MIDNSDSIAFTLYATAWLKDHAAISEISERSISALYDKWRTQLVPHLNKPHKGACIGTEMRCVRCEVEMYFENGAAIAKVINGYKNDKQTEIEIKTETSIESRTD